MPLLEAELVKITLNCALTMKISLANQLRLVAQKLGADSNAIMDAVGSDPRIGHAYLKPGARSMRLSTEEGDICFEPFSGSGSQLVAAEQSKRVCRDGDRAEVRRGRS